MTSQNVTYRPIAQFYDAEYDYLDLVQKDVPFFLERFGPAPRTILEIGVGTGRAAIAFAKAGHRVVGLDYATNVLQIARKKRSAAKVRSKQLQLLHRNAKNFDLHHRFDFICVLFNTFLMLLTLDDQSKCLSSIRRHLNRDGCLILDIVNPNFRMLAEQETTGIGPATFDVPPFGKVTRMTDVVRDPITQMQTFTLRYSWNTRGAQRSADNRFTLTWFTPRELQLLLERNGIFIKRLYGDYDGSRLKADSPRIIACCSRG